MLFMALTVKMVLMKSRLNVVKLVFIQLMMMTTVMMKLISSPVKVVLVLLEIKLNYLVH